MTTIVAYMDSRQEFTDFSNLIHDNLKEYHELYDIYNNYDGKNNLKTINDQAGKTPIKVDKKIIDLLLFSKDIYQKTNGACNIALGSVLQIWHKYRTEGIDNPENAELPPLNELKAAALHTDINSLIINEYDSTVCITDPLMRLDVGAVAKGYATEQVCKIAIKKGYNSGLVSVGGNVRAIGNKGISQELWNVGVQNPDTESTEPILLLTLLDNCSLVTSGIYERYYTVQGEKYHHIIDPKTLMPSTYFKSVTIVCEDSGIADGLSTAAFNMPFEDGLKLINSIPNTEALWVFHNGDIKYSDHFDDYVKK